MTRLDRNQMILVRLHPQFRVLITEFLNRLTARGSKPLLTDGRRTFTEQAAIYAKGRTAPGPIVSHAPPGKSFHNYGLAVDWLDVGVNESFDVSDYDHTDYKAAAIIAQDLGLTWGGMWRMKDLPHIEWHPGLTAQDAETLIAHADGNGFLPVGFFSA